MRYFVRNDKGQELVCPSLPDLHALYNQGFLDDDDLVRPERSRIWVRAGDFPALRGVRELHRDPRRIWLLLAMAIAVAIGVPALVRFLR
jgi:hypothetical protein